MKRKRYSRKFSEWPLGHRLSSGQVGKTRSISSFLKPYAFHGFNTDTWVFLKSLTLRETTVRLW